MEERKEKKSQARIVITDDGQMKITGDFIFRDLKRDVDDAPGEVTLCLCGKTKDKPYCDNSHKAG